MVTVSRLTGVTERGLCAASLLFSAQPVTHASTSAQALRRTSRRRRAGRPTFTKDVLPILQRSCQTLPSARHAGADVAADLSRKCGRGRARSSTKVTSREMPPWHIDRSIGEYLERSRR